MNPKQQINNLWNEIHNQNWNLLKQYFTSDAVINWHNTNESFTVDEFIIANSEYPGRWEIKIERMDQINDLIISVVKVSLKDDNISFHATSYFEFINDKIYSLNEYWGEDNTPPQWRLEKKIGKPIVKFK